MVSVRRVMRLGGTPPTPNRGIGRGGAFIVMGVVVLIAVAASYLWLREMQEGSTRVLCGITASVVGDTDQAAFEPEAEFLARHRALREALDEAAASGQGYSPVASCEEGERTLEALRSAGAPRTADSGGYLVRHEEIPTVVGLSHGVA